MLSNDDIIRIKTDYKDAKYKSKQVNIMAELYAVDPKEIRKILGIENTVIKKRTKVTAAHLLTDKEKSDIAKSVLSGKESINKAAKRAGVSWSSVRYWVSKEE